MHGINLWSCLLLFAALCVFIVGLPIPWWSQVAGCIAALIASSALAGE